MKRVRSSILPLVGWLAHGLRGDPWAADRIREVCRRRKPSGTADFFVTAGVVAMRRAACPGLCDHGDDSCEFHDVCSEMGGIASANLAALGRIGASLNGKRPHAGGPPVLLGDAAVLEVLYGAMDAFLGTLWSVGLESADEDSRGSVTAHAVGAGGSAVRVAPLGRLAELLDDYTQTVELAGHPWRVPNEPLLVTLLAARVGEPEATPLPPVWVHLVVALKAWCLVMDMQQVLEIAERLGVAPQVHRGFAIAVAIDPEIEGYLPMEQLELPWWERKVASRIAARRLLLDAYEWSTAFGPGDGGG